MFTIVLYVDFLSYAGHVELLGHTNQCQQVWGSLQTFIPECFLLLFLSYSYFIMPNLVSV